MQPIISIVGRSDSGKTTLLEKLIAELKLRGYRVAIIKHSAEDVELDNADKDTWKLSQAGSDISAISSGRKLAIFKNLDRDFEPREIARFISSDYDILLTEGFKQGPYPKIEIHRKEQGHDLVSPPEQLLALVTDEKFEMDVPQFSREDIGLIADLIEQKIAAQPENIELLVNDTSYPLTDTGMNLLKRTLVAIIAGLGISDGIKNLHISLRRKD